MNVKAPDLAVDLARLLTSEAVQSRISDLATAVPSVSGSDLNLSDPFLSNVAEELLASRDHQLYYDQALGPVAGELLNDVTLELGLGRLASDEATQRIEEAAAQLR